MQLKTTDFVFDIVPDDGQCIEVRVKTQVEVPSAIHGSDWEWVESNKRLYLMKDVPFIEGVQKMLKWAYTEAF